MKPALLLALLVLLSACSPRQDASGVWNNYLNRLETVLDAPAPEGYIRISVFKPATLPQAAPRISIGVLDLLKLDKCRIGSLVSERNNALGKVSTASQQFIYHIRFIQQAPDCIDVLSKEYQELSQTLQQARTHKQQQAGEAFTRLLVNDASLRASFFAGTSSLQLDSALAGLTELEIAIHALLNIKRAVSRGDFETIETDKIESYLEAFYRQNLIQGYMAGSRDSLRSLERVNLLLTENARFNQCITGGNNRSREILATVFRKYYLPGGQAYMAKLRQIQFRLGPLLMALYRGTPVADAVNFYFGEGDNTLHSQMQTQIDAHVTWWQRLQDSCGNLF